MNILILGGTVFLGRHLVEVARARGHTVTLFNRGRHNPELFPEVERLRGDRGGDLQALEGRRWDAAIDTSGYIPRAVSASAGLLAPNIDHYTFISSISVYSDVKHPGIAEGAPVATLADPTTEEVTGETYGALKALCEQAAEAAMPGRVLIIRPGLIVGPHDPTDRFTYWVQRIAAGGEVLAPGNPDVPVQVIDVRDLATWTIRMVEEHRTGVYNATGPAERLSMGQLLEATRQATGSDASFTWVDDAFLLRQGVGPWIEVPLWIPPSDENSGGLLDVSIAKALAAGLEFRPVADIVRDTLAWDRTRPADVERRAGLKPERERQLLQAWRERNAATP
jgi:2'-hydroxyisoflavone reductase